MKKQFYSFTEISNYAFANVQNGGKIIIPASVTTIGQEAFNNAYFETIEFAPGCELTSIGYMAFSFVHVQSIVLPPVTSVDLTSMFGNWGSDKTDLLTCLSFAEGTETLAGKISNISLEEIVLPTTLTSIDKEAFLNCSSLQSITIGSQAAADILFDGGIPETVTTLKLKDGITASIDGFETDRLGTFIVCILGVAFVMPMWGYAVILAACILVLAAAITAAVVLVRRKKNVE